MQPKILVSDPIAQEGIDVLARRAQVDVKLGLKPPELCDIVGEYDGMVVRSETKVTAEVIRAGRRLRVVGRAGVGVDNIDIAAATERGIVVVNAPTGNITSAAEHTIGLMLALARHIPQAHQSLMEGRWQRARFIGLEVRGKTLGIVGLGQVGSEVARRAKGLEMRVLACDPYVPEERAHALGVELVSLEDLLRESDFVALNTALTPQTRMIIGAKEIALMKPAARLINTARGELVDEEALARALEEGRLAGAALDVFSQEPPGESPLLKSDKVIV
ncbi:MAG TPA: hydroxyacid dehydrogenase, partial [Dehalococcoidia bacterium]|nr:hydroxyacid dehydrogenase [Dehalococcoidia bacterium]